MPQRSEQGRKDACVSMVITCYNQARYLSESIESVFSQGYSNLQVTVIDDGSKDHPQSEVTKYPSVHFIQQHNQGVSVARNRGVQESDGELLVFLDADDRLLAGAIQTGVDSFTQNPGLGFVFGKGILIDAAGLPLPEPYQPPLKNAGYLELLQHNPIPFPALVMHKRSVVEAVGGFRSLVGKAFIGNTADYDLYLRIASSYPIHFHGAKVAEWRQHSTNTSRNSLMMLKSCMRVLNAQSEKVRDDPQLNKALKLGKDQVGRYYSEQLIEELRAEFRERNLSLGRLTESILALLTYHPSAFAENAFGKFRKLVARSK